MLDTVRLAVIVPATVRLLDAVVKVAATLDDVDAVVITSGSDGEHSGPSDPHHLGRALDLRSHNFPDAEAKSAFVGALTHELGERFFVFLEDGGTANEHVHVQLRRFLDYPPPPIHVTAPRKV